MDAGGTLLTDPSGKLIVGGINTFNGAFGAGGDPGMFATSGLGTVGGLSGGMMLGAYHAWIHSIIGVDLDLSSTITVAPGTGGNTEVTYELDVTNNGPNDASNILISQTDLDVPAGATVSVDGLSLIHI